MMTSGLKFFFHAEALGYFLKSIKRHWVLDTIFNEDYCLVRKNNAAANLNVLRKIALNTLKQVDFSDVVKAKQLPLCHKQRLCDKRQDCLERLLFSL